jgi:hypothetical protein
VTNHPPRPIFALRIQGAPGVGGIHALRAVLKILLRRYGFRVLDAREEAAPDVSNQIANAFTVLRRDVRDRRGSS